MIILKPLSFVSIPCLDCKLHTPDTVSFKWYPLKYLILGVFQSQSRSVYGAVSILYWLSNRRPAISQFFLCTLYFAYYVNFVHALIMNGPWKPVLRQLKHEMIHPQLHNVYWRLLINIYHCAYMYHPVNKRHTVI
mgnify:CR=1 FL=1